MWVLRTATTSQESVQYKVGSRSGHRILLHCRVAHTFIRQGFYGVTYSVGFRDDFNPSTEQIVNLVSELEARADPANSIRVIAELKSVATRTSHMYALLPGLPWSHAYLFPISSIPHHYVISKYVDFGFASPVMNPIRRFLIESIYRRLSTMFPETANWTLDNEEYVHRTTIHGTS